MKHCFLIALTVLASAFTEEEELSLLEAPQLSTQTMDLQVFDEKAPPLDDVDFPKPQFTKKEPGIAVLLSAFVPGLGNGYLGDYKTAGSIFGSAGSFITAGSVSNGGSFSLNNFVLAQNTWMYGMYAAYRDARSYNNDSGYSYSMPKESFKELSMASFQWSVISKPEVWGGLLGALAIASGLTYLIDTDENQAAMSSQSRIFPLTAFPVGIGEETLFRGFMLPAFTEAWGPNIGLIASSLAFGAIHIPNAALMSHQQKRNYYAFGIPFITGMGAYMGWLTQKNTSLKESVALHSWYDFILFLASYSATSSITRQKPTFAFSVAF